MMIQMFIMLHISNNHNAYWQRLSTKFTLNEGSGGLNR